MNSGLREYPRTVSCKGRQIELRLLTPGDEAALKAFIATIPEHDLLFLNSDITHPKVVDAWIAAAAAGHAQSLLAWDGGKVVGSTAIILSILPWFRHVGELRVLVSPDWRGNGLGRILMQECFAQALALGLEKLCAQTTVDQPAAISGFESMGFRAEALYRNHVKDSAGKLHDLAVLSHHIAEVRTEMQLLGITEALGG